MIYLNLYKDPKIKKEQASNKIFWSQNFKMSKLFKNLIPKFNR